MKAEHSRFLNRLRESGATNMWGASPYLEDTFGVDHVTAVDILVEWMDSFSSGGVNDPEAERVLRILMNTTAR